MLNPSQAIADALAPQILTISNSSDAEQLEDILDAALGSRHLIKNTTGMSVRDYRSKVKSLKPMQSALDTKVDEKPQEIVYERRV